MMALAGWLVREVPRKTMLTQPGPEARAIRPLTSMRRVFGRYQIEPRIQKRRSPSQTSLPLLSLRGASAYAASVARIAIRAISRPWAMVLIVSLRPIRQAYDSAVRAYPGTRAGLGAPVCRGKNCLF